MAKILQNLSLPKLSRAVREARQRQGWTLEQLSYELRASGLPTAQNKLWRLENNPPKRIDTELLLFLEKVLEVELLECGEKRQVLMGDVIELLDQFVESADGKRVPQKPGNRNLHGIFERLDVLSRRQN